MSFQWRNLSVPQRGLLAAVALGAAVGRSYRWRVVDSLCAKDLLKVQPGWRDSYSNSVRGSALELTAAARLIIPGRFP